jgi:tripartite-type tricarboxylate transporter receptor subunit TctC
MRALRHVVVTILLPLPRTCGIVARRTKKSIRENFMRPMSCALAVCALVALTVPAAAQDYPSRPIRAIASQGPGGLSDVWMRAAAEKMGPILGGTVVVENHTGASGSIGARACADAPPDGYTICIMPPEPLTTNPIIFPNQGNFDPNKSLTPITRPFYLQQVFAVNAEVGVKTFDQLAALAKAKPGTLNYMAPSLPKVAFMEHFNKTKGTDIVRVPFKGGGDGVNNMLTGTTQIAIFGIGNVIQFIRSGKIVGLAVDGDKHSPLAPDIPTFKELGFTDFIGAASFGIYAPTGTPKAIIDKLNAALVKVGEDPDFQQRNMIPRGLAPVFNSPEEFAKERSPTAPRLSPSSRTPGFIRT